MTYATSALATRRSLASSGRFQSQQRVRQHQRHQSKYVNETHIRVRPKVMDTLPEELLQHVIDFLDVDPPSVTANAQEPNLQDYFTQSQPLKNLCLVSKKYRRLVDPILYQYLRVNVDSISTDRLPSLVTGSQSTMQYQLREWNDPDTGDRFLARLSRAENAFVHLARDDGAAQAFPVADLSLTDKHYIDLLYDHVLAENTKDLHDSRISGSPQDFLSFVATKGNLHRLSAKSLTVYDSTFSSHGHTDRPIWQRNRIWDAIRSFLNPERLVIIANPTKLTELVSCHSDDYDAWAFHIPFQRIELRQKQPLGSLSERERNYNTSARSRDSSVLFTRFWDSFRYDEGSSLNAYGTYHYFEKVGRAHTTANGSEVHVLQRPQSIVNRNSLKLLDMGTWLRCFTYTAVFPHCVHFNSVLDILSEFRSLVQLTVELAPDMRSSLLDDQERIGRGNMRLTDCWSELEQCYFGVANRLLKVDASPLVLLDRFEPLDYKNHYLIELLDRVLNELAPHWVKCSDGAWEKHPLPALPAPSAHVSPAP